MIRRPRPSSTRPGLDRIPPLLGVAIHEALEESYLTPTAFDNIQLTSPKYEEFEFGDFVESVFNGDLYTAEAEPEVSVSESGCQICVWIKVRVSIWAQETGWGFCYIVPGCEEEEEEEIPPPPPRPPRHPSPPILPPTQEIRCFSEPRFLKHIKQTRVYPSGLTVVDTAPNRFYPAGCWALIVSSFTYNLRYSSTSYHNTSASWYLLPKSQAEWSSYISNIRETASDAALSVKQRELIKRGYEIFGVYENVSLAYSPDRRNPSGFVSQTTTVLIFSERQGDLPGDKPPPPPDPDDMSCCKNQRDNEALLRKIARAVGVRDFPASLPKSYLNSIPGQEQIKSIPEMVAHLFVCVDAVLGSFPLDIKITDIDPETQGNQERKIEIENLAEGVAELFALGVKTSVDADNILEGLLRLIPEVLSTKAATLIAQSYAKANADFLGYKGNETVWTVPINFKSDLEGAENLKGLFQSGNTAIKVWKNESKESLVDYLQRLMFAAGLVKASLLHKDSSELTYSLEDEIAQKAGEEASGDFQMTWDRFVELVNTDGVFNRSEGAPRPKAREVPFTNPDPT